MALKFVGRLSPGSDGELVQQFVRGVIVVRESRRTDSGIEGKALALKPEDIGKRFEFWNEEDILKRYPRRFERV